MSRRSPQAGKPYQGVFRPDLESDVDIQVYHKSASADKKPRLRSKFNAKRMLPGWDLHVVYTSMASQRVELYERSPKMTEQEFHLLAFIARSMGSAGPSARPTRIAAGAAQRGREARI